MLTAAAPARVGRFTVADDTVAFDAEPGVALTINGESPTPGAKLRDDDADDTDEIVVNGVSIVVHRTGERLALRVRDPNGERAQTFRGFSWFPISREYRVVGRFMPDAVAHNDSGFSGREIMQAIANTPPLYRDAVIAVDVLGLSYREAARSLRTREATITTRLHRGRHHVLV